MTTLHLSHIKNDKCGFKNYVQIMSKKKVKKKASSNEEFISEMHWNFPKIYIFLILIFLNEMIVVNLFFRV